VKIISERLGHGNVAITIATDSHVLPVADAATAHTLAKLILGGLCHLRVQTVYKPRSRRHGQRMPFSLVSGRFPTHASVAETADALGLGPSERGIGPSRRML
jgi:hypothetical protein